MAGDEAVLRIVTESDEPRGGYSEEASSRAEPFRAPGAAYVPPNEKAVWQKLISDTFGEASGKRQKLEPQEAGAEDVEGTGSARLVAGKDKRIRPPEPDEPFDPMKAAQARLEKERRTAEAEAAYQKLNPSQGTEPFDPAKLANDRLEKEKRFQQVEDEYQKLNPAAPDSPFDPVKLAQDRLEKEKKLQAIDEEYRKLNPAKPDEPFDPFKAARDRLDKEKRAADVEAAYQKINPPAPEKPFDPYDIARKKMGAASQQKMVNAAAAELESQQSLFGSIMGKALGPSLGAAAAGAIGSVVAAQLTPQAMGRIGAGFGYKGASGGAAAIGANFLETLPPVTLAVALFGSELKATIQKIRDAGEISAVQIGTSDLFRAEIIQNRQELARIEGMLGSLSVANPAYRQLAVDVAKKEAAYQAQNAFNQRINRLAPFSPQISMANAQRQVGQQQAAIGEAAIGGDRFAEFVKAQGSNQREQDIGAMLKSLLAIQGQLDNLNASTTQMKEDNKKLAAELTEKIKEDAATRIRAAKNDDERLKIEKDRDRRLQALQDQLAGKGKSNLEELIEGMEAPADPKKDDKKDKKKEAPPDFRLKMAAFDV